MNRRQFQTSVFSAGVALWSGQALALDLSERDAASGIRAALERGALAAIGLLGQQDGFLGNERVRIGLPGALNDAAKLLRLTGQQHKVEELITAMNRAAEAAMPEAKALLVQTVKNLSVQDALQLVRSGETSVTDFFAYRTREPLGLKFLPIVKRATDRLAAADKYNALAGKAAKLGLLKAEDANVQQYVTQRALDGLYLTIGDEERKIRQDPVGTGSAILKKVFGG